MLSSIPVFLSPTPVLCTFALPAHRMFRSVNFPSLVLVRRRRPLSLRVLSLVIITGCIHLNVHRRVVCV